MTAPAKHLANSFTHIELNTTDPTAAKAFYSKLFPDWKLEDMPMPTGSYTMIKPSSGTGGGILQHPVPGAPSAWLAYIAVEDIKTSTEKARSLGAKVMQEPKDIGPGSLSVLIDPTGAAFALWQNKTA